MVCYVIQIVHELLDRLLFNRIGRQDYQWEDSSSVFLLGDNVFAKTIGIITPKEEDYFNLEQILLRMNIECVIGELINQWKIL